MDNRELANRIVDALFTTAVGSGYRIDVRTRDQFMHERSLGGYNRDAAVTAVVQVLESAPSSSEPRRRPLSFTGD